MTDLIPVSQIEQQLARATTPAETHEIEAIARARIAYSKEQGDYESMVAAVWVLLQARRKTTELIDPYIQHGGEGNSHVTLLSDFGFTKMQWSRRKAELEASFEKLQEYFDECIAKGWNPSIAGALNYANEQAPKKRTLQDILKALFNLFDELLKHAQGNLQITALQIAQEAINKAFGDGVTER